MLGKRFLSYQANGHPPKFAQDHVDHRQPEENEEKKGQSRWSKSRASPEGDDGDKGWQAQKDDLLQPETFPVERLKLVRHRGTPTNAKIARETAFFNREVVSYLRSGLDWLLL